ncbi:hypothetical protein KI387_031648, partial [Taxus chinensis]
ILVCDRQEYQITLKARMSTKIGITIKCTMIRMRGVMKEVVAEVEDTVVDSEDEAMVVEG